MARINPKIDIAFRKLFGSQENKEILRGFINSVLPSKDQIKSLVIKNPYNLATYVKGKSSVLDVKAEGEDGRLFDVEMQIGEQQFFGKRIKYYLDKMYTSQIAEGETYHLLKKVIGIGILDFNYFADERYQRGVTYKDIVTDETYPELDLSDIYFIELKKFNKDLKELRTSLERWVTFLNRAHEYRKDEIPPELAVDSNIKEAIEKLDIMYLSTEEQEIYESEEKRRLDTLEELRTAEKKGLEKGLKQGKEEGFKEGKEEGFKQGKEEVKYEIIIDMIKNGMDDLTISKVTKISIEEIQAQRAEL